MMPALLIAIEGSDGSGKETQSTLLKAYFEAQGKRVVSISFPRYKDTTGGKALFQMLKGEHKETYNFIALDPRSASLIYAADRHESQPYLKTLIDSHDVVIFDRYVESNLLHQGGKFHDEEEKNSFASFLYHLEYDLLALPKPHVVVYLELPWEVSRNRAKIRALANGKTLDAGEDDESYMKNSHEAGIFYAAKFGWLCVQCVESGRELTRDEVHIKVFSQLANYFGEKF